MNFKELYRGRNIEGFEFLCFGIDNDHKIDIVFKRDHIWIDDVFVLQTSRMQGVGRALINQVEHIACQKNLNLIRGKLVPGAGINSADLSIFWQKLGFVINDLNIGKVLICK